MARGNLQVSVIIATYNRRELLAETLRQLGRQSLPADAFEVIVGDDGSSDGTADLVRSMSGSLNLKYYYQEDLGFRAAAARNGAARLAGAPLLVFLDTGKMPGPDFLAAHLAAHTPDRPRQAAAGVMYGYNPRAEMRGIDELLTQMPPETVVDRFRELPEFQDIRRPMFDKCGYDLMRLSVPWQLFWTGNCSVRTDDFRRVGGFEEMFHGWGGEDMELAYRLQRSGLQISVLPEAWVVAAPHPRDRKTDLATFDANMTMFLDKTPVPIVEIGWSSMLRKGDYWLWEGMYQRLLEWQGQTRDLSVRDEMALALADMPREERVAVIGCGGDIPGTLQPAVLVEYDQELLGRAMRTGAHAGYHAVGVRTALADDCVDSVLITSRMSGLWDDWGTELLAEASRIGRRTVCLAGPRAPSLPTYEHIVLPIS